MSPERAVRAMALGDLEEVLAIQEEGSVFALAHVFPQQDFPFPRRTVRDRWERELDATDTECFVMRDADGIVGFAALRSAELLHFGTARATWGSGLARLFHDELLDRIESRGETRARLWVFEANGHARRFYEHRGWIASGVRSRSGFSPYPVLLEYTRELDSKPDVAAP